MLATLPPDDVRALLARTGMPAYTEHTHTDVETFLTHLERIAEEGHALDESEQELGVRCIAVAVPDAPVPAAVSVSGPEGRLTDEVVRAITPAVQRTAKRLSEQLAARHPAE
jgi:IclR family acetate operon transcriptional repressor